MIVSDTVEVGTKVRVGYRALARGEDLGARPYRELHGTGLQKARAE
jgi:hypothetical protein